MSQLSKAVKPNRRRSPFILTCFTVSPALLFVLMNLSWDAVLFLIIYTGLSAWVVQILHSEQQNK